MRGLTEASREIKVKQGCNRATLAQKWMGISETTKTLKQTGIVRVETKKSKKRDEKKK